MCWSRSPGGRKGGLRISVYFKAMHLFFCFAECQYLAACKTELFKPTPLRRCWAPALVIIKSVVLKLLVLMSAKTNLMWPLDLDEIFQCSEHHLCTQSIVLFLVIFLCLRYPDVPFFSLPPLRSYPFLVRHTQCCWHHLHDCWWPISSNHNILKSFNCGILHLKHLTKCCFSEKWEIKVLSSMVSCHAFALCAPQKVFCSCLLSAPCSGGSPKEFPPIQ